MIGCEHTTTIAHMPTGALMLALLSALVQSTSCNDRARVGQILLRTDTIDARPETSVSHLFRDDAPRLRWNNDGRASQNVSSHPSQLLVLLHTESCSRSHLAGLVQGFGGHVLYHVSRCAFSVLAANTSAAMALADSDAIAWAGPMLPRNKVSPELLTARKCPVFAFLTPHLCQSGNVGRAGAGRAGEDDGVGCSSMTGTEWAAELAARWMRELPQISSAKAVSPSGISVWCANSDVLGLVHALAESPYVQWLDQYLDIHKRNYHAAFNQVEGEVQSDMGVVWSRGVNGTGEIVHLADSGVDVGHCLFHDTAVGVPYNRVDTSHRKVVAYWSGRTGDKLDAVEGHGTHVAATIAGSLGAEQATNEVSRYQGIAPGAKLAVTDGEKQTATDGEGSLKFEDDIVTNIYRKPLVDTMSDRATVECAVQSHSWGTTEYTYTAAAVDLDKFLHDNREALMVWAAGNDGQNKDRPMTTVGSPATAKNCLTVGATLPGIDAMRKVRSEGHAKYTLNRKQLEEEASAFSNQHVAHYSARGPVAETCDGESGPRECGRLKPDLVLPGLVQSAASNGRLTNTNCCLRPECGRTTQCPKDCNGHGSCVSNGAVGDDLHVCQCSVGYCGRDCSTKTDNPIPDNCCIDPALGSIGQVQCLNGGECKDDRQGSVGSYKYATCQCSESREFGGINCATRRLASLATLPKMGTSMAAPVAAGMAAMLRQYLRKGFYPSGLANVADAMAPAGALLKAMLLTAAAQPSGGVVQLFISKELADRDPLDSMKSQMISGKCEDLSPVFEHNNTDKPHCAAMNEALKRFPNPIQGFGRPNVENVLYFSTPSPDGKYPPSVMNLFLQDATDNNRLATGSEREFCFFHSPDGADGGGPLVVTLTWTDPAGSPAGAKALVNDLDLEIRDTCGAIHTPHSAWEKDAEAMTQDQLEAHGLQRDPSGALRDRINNVERLVLPDGGAGCFPQSRRVYVRVVGHYVPEGPQSFAVAATSASALPCHESVDLLQTLMASVYLVLDVQVGINISGKRKDELRGTWASALRLPSRLVLIVSVAPDGKGMRLAVHVDTQAGQTVQDLYDFIRSRAQVSPLLKDLQIINMDAVAGSGLVAMAVPSTKTSAPLASCLACLCCVVASLVLFST